MGLCALAALAVVSCKKNEEQAATTSFEATIAQPKSGNRTEIGADNWMIWKNGDAIQVFTEDGTASEPFTTIDEGETTASFSGEIKGADSYRAFYPAANVTAEGTTVTLTLDANQVYKNGTFSTNTYPLAAVSDASDKTRFNFSSPCGMLAIPVHGSGTIGSIVLTSKGNNDQLAGTYTYSLGDMGNPSFSGTATSVTLTCENGLTLDPDHDVTMYFVLPAGSLASGFTAVMYGTGTTGTELHRVETSNNPGIAALNISMMDPVNVKAPNVTTNEPQSSEIGGTSVTLRGSYEALAGMSVTEVGFYYRRAIDPEYTKQEATLANPFSYVLENLEEGREYEFKSYIIASGNKEYAGVVATFTTLARPTVTTGTVTDIAATTAKASGEVTAAGGAEVTERGVCWSTNQNPTIDGSHASNGTGTGSYTVNMTDLAESTKYYVRAYATNSVGTSYGSQVEFTTLADAPTIPAPDGSIRNGVFSVSASKKVYFSKGNLQYGLSTMQWSFMEHQYDMVEYNDAYIGNDYSGGDVNSVSLFGFGTSGRPNGSANYQPYNTAYVSDNGVGDHVFLYGPLVNGHMVNPTGEYYYADWGYNAISNGGNQQNMGWRTLTLDEWNYLLGPTYNNPVTNCREGYRFVKANVCGRNGLIILPDGWGDNNYQLNAYNNMGSYSNNSIDATAWATLEEQGAVFLPAAGYRRGGTYFPFAAVGTTGSYWTSSVVGDATSRVSYVDFNNDVIATNIPLNSYYGFSVRLVFPAN